jgi:hypothetical protein
MRDWKTSRRIVWRELDFPGYLNFFSRDGEKFLRLRLEGQQRHWAVSLIPRQEVTLNALHPPGTGRKQRTLSLGEVMEIARQRTGREPNERLNLAGPEVRFWQKLTEFSLNRVKDLVFDWPETTERRLPLDLAFSSNAEPLTYEQWLNLYGLDERLGFLRTIVDCYWDFSSIVGPVTFRRMPRTFADYDRSRAQWTEEQRRHARSLLIFLAESCEDDANLPHHSMLAGHPNFINDVKQTIPLACAVFPNTRMRADGAIHS